MIAKLSDSFCLLVIIVKKLLSNHKLDYARHRRTDRQLQQVVTWPPERRLIHARRPCLQHFGHPELIDLNSSQWCENIKRRKNGKCWSDINPKWYIVVKLAGRAITVNRETLTALLITTLQTLPNHVSSTNSARIKSLTILDLVKVRNTLCTVNLWGYSGQDDLNRSNGYTTAQHTHFGEDSQDTISQPVYHPSRPTYHAPHLVQQSYHVDNQSNRTEFNFSYPHQPLHSRPQQQQHQQRFHQNQKNNNSYQVILI